MELTDTSLQGATKSSKALPGDFAIWVFIFAELLVFGVLFAAYAFARANNVELFAQYQQTLDRSSGAINTALLLTASYFVVMAVAAIRKGRVRACRDWLLASIACGAGFLVVKTLEFIAKFDEGVTLSSNTFYFFYLSLTAFHYLHVWLGMVILVAVAWKAHRGAYTEAQHHGVESGASYWHMVDLVWLVLFPLVYLVR